MRHVAVFAAIISIVLLAIVLLAGAYATLALGFGSILRRVVSLDVFQGTIVGLIAVGASGVIVLRLVRKVYSGITEQSSDEDNQDESDGDDDDESELEQDYKSPSAFREVIAIVDATSHGRRNVGSRKRNRRKPRH